MEEPGTPSPERSHQMFNWLCEMVKAFTTSCLLCTFVGESPEAQQGDGAELQAGSMSRARVEVPLDSAEAPGADHPAEGDLPAAGEPESSASKGGAV